MSLCLWCRYQQEQKEQREAELELERERAERCRLQQLKKETALRDKLIKNVQHLEQRKMEVQRELVLRNLPAGQSQLKSAVVIPKN